MSAVKIADLVVAIPYGDGMRKRYKNVGALFKQTDNDPSKGPGFTISLDSTFNPAGAPSKGGDVWLSCYNPKPERPWTGASNTPRLHPSQPPDDLDDDIPF